MTERPPETPPQGTGEGAHGPMRLESWAEKRLREPRQVRRKVTVPVETSAARRAYNLSEKHLAMLAENRRKMAERGQRPTTRGAVHGYGGTRGKRLLREARASAQKEAERIMTELIDKGIVNKDDAGNDALRFGIEVIKTVNDKGVPIYSTDARLKAARMVLDYTMAKPESKQRVTVETAEQWLDALADKDDAAE